VIHDHRPDTLTPLLKEVRDFHQSLPRLFELAQARDPRLGQAVRQALREIHHYHCPIGKQLGPAWAFVIAEKLTSPNKWLSSGFRQHGNRTKWERLLKAAILRALGVASWQWLDELGRLPATSVKMTLQIVRLVPSSREFIRDDDNLAFSRKQVSDAMKHVGLLKEDRREWLEALTIHQDVTPNGKALTVFFLWPTAPGLLDSIPSHPIAGVPHV
jgi:hypothetical protein